MSWLVKLALAAAAVAAVIGGYTWWRGGVLQEGVLQERAIWVAKEKQDLELRDSDARQQRQFNDQAATNHITAVNLVNKQLGIANEKIAKLSGRQCLDADTVRVLNDIGSTPGDKPGRAAAGELAGTPEAVATDQDVSTAIAICRAWYGELSDQVNQILDIEDRRHPLPATAAEQTPTK